MLYNDAVALLQELIRTPSFSREEDATAAIIEQWLREKLATSAPGMDDCGSEIGDQETHGAKRSTVQTGVHRSGNNVWVKNLHFNTAKPTILLCSHHDTVRPSGAWTRDPFEPVIEQAGDGSAVSMFDCGDSTCNVGENGVSSGNCDGITGNGGARLYGLGSNDAGASAVSMAAAFRHFHRRNDLKYNLILALVGEEEISGPGGVRSILPELGLGRDTSIAIADVLPASESVSAVCTGASTGRADALATATETSIASTCCSTADFAIVGEPTGMQLAIAEKGLLVLDCVAHGRAGHAARDEGDNAIYHAIKDIERLCAYRFERESPLFGPVRMNVTMIAAGTQHNVVPAECRFTVDCRVTEQYSNEEVLETVRQIVTSEVTPRSLHLRSSSISPSHPVVLAGIELGMSTFGSPTTSDQVALTAIPSVKVGPGQSARSHAADEYIELGEIEQGICMYIRLLDKLL